MAIPILRHRIVLNYEAEAAGLKVEDLIERLLKTTEQVVFENAIDGAEAVFPSDLLSFVKGSSVIGDPDLVDPHIRNAGDLCRDFGLKAESIFLQLNSLDDFSSEHLVAGFHVTQVQVGECIAQGGQELVSERMPKEENAMRLATGITRSIDHIGMTVQQGLKKQIVFVRVVFEIGVLDHHEIACSVFDARPQGCSFS